MKSVSVSKKYTDPFRYPIGIAYMDGQYIPISRAKVSILDWGFLHSDATYDTIHVWNGRFFRVDRHLDRFFSGIKKLHMQIPYNKAEILEILQNCVGLTGYKKAYVEVICTRGVSPTFSRDPREALNRFMAFAVPFGSIANDDQLKYGLNIAISDVVRIPPESIDPDIKNYHWLDLVKGLYDGYEKKADTVLLRNLRGNITEGPGFNIFLLKNGTLRTPETGVLAGITRGSVIDICGEIGIPVETTEVSVSDLNDAEEIFITSTAGGVMPVTRIEGEAVGDGLVGAVTRRLTEVYWEKHEDPTWSTKVHYESVGD